MNAVTLRRAARRPARREAPATDSTPALSTRAARRDRFSQNPRTNIPRPAFGVLHTNKSQKRVLDEIVGFVLIFRAASTCCTHLFTKNVTGTFN